MDASLLKRRERLNTAHDSKWVSLGGWGEAGRLEGGGGALLGLKD